jgi:hypothetical protein
MANAAMKTRSRQAASGTSGARLAQIPAPAAGTTDAVGSGASAANCLPAGDEELLDRFESAAFRYFQENVNPANGLVADTTRVGSPSSIAVVGFALSCYPIGVERGWMTRAEAVKRTVATLRFFRDSSQNDRPDATGFKGFYYHFLDLQTGKRAWQSELSLIDSALLAAGILTAQAYFHGPAQSEEEIRKLADALYRRMDWQWAQNGSRTVSQGWEPECGFLHYGWEGYNEALILYALGLGSPTYPLSADSYTAWTSTYQWENLYGHDHLYAGPLFIHQFAHAWIDFKGVRDRFMREKRSDYFENTRTAAFIQREYAMRNPRGYMRYGENYWGLTACDGPGPMNARIDGVDRRLVGYAARGIPYGPDDATISPAAVFGTIPFAPDIALPAIRQICQRHPRIAGNYRVPNGLNPTLTIDDPLGWASDGYLGLDQGLIVLMIENYRSRWLWNLMRRCTWLRTGLRKAGFTGGWLRWWRRSGLDSDAR